MAQINEGGTPPAGGPQLPQPVVIEKGGVSDAVHAAGQLTGYGVLGIAAREIGQTARTYLEQRGQIRQAEISAQNHPAPPSSQSPPPPSQP